MPAKIWSRRMLGIPLCLTALWCIVVYALFLWVARSEADHVRELALSQARTLFTQLVSTRAWNAMYGGVFVLESERDRPNLDLPENRRAVETSEGLRLIRVNPAYMTRQIAEIVNSRQGVTFHITSLDPVRKENAPDPWETEALFAFQEGEKEVFALCENAQRFRYMAPLHVDATCWECHYVEPRGILRPDRPQETYQLKGMGQSKSADAKLGDAEDTRSPLALGATPKNDSLVSLAADCPAVESGGDTGFIAKSDPNIPTLRGGISVSMAAGPLLAVEAGRVRILAMAYGGIGLLGLIGIGGATLLMSRRQAVAEAANRTKTVFLANMSHDMRTPLAGMLGMVELMQGKECTEEKRTEYLHMLRSSADNLLEIVNDITDFSRLEAGKMILFPRAFSVREEIATVLDLFRFTCERKGLALGLYVDKKVPEYLVGDAFRLRQALGNLLGNAVKFTDHGRIDVAVQVLEDYDEYKDEGTIDHSGQNRGVLVRFSVRDTGCGIVKEEHERIFESFVQSTASSQRSFAHSGGSGLGLAIVRDIAMLFGGQVAVESEFGHGSFFWFTAYLAVSSQKEDPALLAVNKQDTELGLTDTKHEKATFTILVADDNPVVRLFFHETLTHAGYKVLLAENGKAAFDLLLKRVRKQKSPICHMALLDVRMPNGSGVELLRSIRNGELLGVPTTMPTYMVTASALCDEYELRGTVDADGVLLKPMQASALRELVDGVYQLWCQKEYGDAEPICPVQNLDQGTDDMDYHKKSPCNSYLALQGLDGNEALLQALITAFIPEAKKRRERLAQAINSLDINHIRILREEAHALANSAGVLCCEELLHQSRSLEQLIVDTAAKDTAPSDVRMLVPHAKAMLDTLDEVIAVLVDMVEVKPSEHKAKGEE